MMTTTDSKGLLITFEGNEGSGKSTEIDLLHERLQSSGKTVTKLREPGGTGLGELLREILKTPKDGVEIDPVAELLLMNASRAQLVRQVIRPALDRGEVILVDRFFDSTVVYQGYGRGWDINLVQKIIDVAIGDTRPSLTFLLKVPVSVSEERRATRNSSNPASRDRFEGSERAFFERIDQGYESLSASARDRIKVIDATHDIQTVHATIWNHFETFL